MRTLQTQPVPNGDVVRIIMHEQGLLLRRKEFWVVKSWWGQCTISATSLSLLGLLWKRITCVCKKYSLILWAIRWIQSWDSPWDLYTLLDLVNSLQDPPKWWKDTVFTVGVVIVLTPMREAFQLFLQGQSLVICELQRARQLGHGSRPQLVHERGWIGLYWLGPKASSFLVRKWDPLIKAFWFLFALHPLD